MTNPVQKDGPCDYSFPCSEYHKKCQATYNQAKETIDGLHKGIAEANRSITLLAKELNTRGVNDEAILGLLA